MLMPSHKISCFIAKGNTQSELFR